MHYSQIYTPYTETTNISIGVVTLDVLEHYLGYHPISALLEHYISKLGTLQ